MHHNTGAYYKIQLTEEKRLWDYRRYYRTAGAHSKMQLTEEKRLGETTVAYPTAGARYDGEADGKEIREAEYRAFESSCGSQWDGERV